ncbi:MAG: hypothetical protein LBV16_04745 [Elusimicrobiota bacterium]|nr:hypothetical protein [Elusimicrobiota bacterium]
MNIDIAHEQIFYEDNKESNEEYSNEGFFDTGKGKVDKDKIENLPLYTTSDRKHYDDAIMRKAVKNVSPAQNQYSLLGIPFVKDKYNCQDFIDDVRKEYYRLENIYQ